MESQQVARQGVIERGLGKSTTSGGPIQKRQLGTKHTRPPTVGIRVRKQTQKRRVTRLRMKRPLRTRLLLSMRSSGCLVSAFQAHHRLNLRVRS